MWLLFLFIGVPLIEIALFIQVGGAIGLWWTLLIVILTALLGSFMIRTQGTLAMRDIRQSIERFDDPTEPLANGAMILFAGALLLTPGFFTDTVGFLLLLPAFRKAAFNFARSRIKVANISASSSTRGPAGRSTTFRQGTVIDGEFHEVKDSGKSDDQKPSGWTRH